MIKTDEEVHVRFKVLETLKTGLPRLGFQIKSFGHKPRSNGQTEEISEPDAAVNDLDREGSLTSEPGFPSLEILLEENSFATPYTILLGLCDDGLPLTLNLTNPAPGSILIAGDSDAGKTRLIHSILTSLTLLNTSEQGSFSIIAANEHEYTDLGELEYCQKLVSLNDREAIPTFQMLFAESEDRRLIPSEKVKILVIDDLYQFSKTLDQNLLSDFHRLIKHGPRLGIWTLATLNSKDLEWIEPALLEAFRTHLLGYITDPIMRTFLGQGTSAPPEDLTCGSQFCASTNDGWLTFWICDSSGGGL